MNIFDQLFPSAATSSNNLHRVCNALLRSWANALIVSVFFPIIGMAQEIMDCGINNPGYGPFDYTNVIHVKEKLPIVERAHFTSDVENLIRGSSGTDPIGDISYTLQRFPNHHRALYAMVRYYLRAERRPIAGTRLSPECFFFHANNFNPSDGNVYMIHGIYLHRMEILNASLEKYYEALELMPDSSELHYNIGLLFFDMGNYEMSRKYANSANELGYPMPSLRKKLAKIGY